MVANFECQSSARAHGTAIDEQSTGAANLHVTRSLGARESQPLAHHIEQKFVRFDLDFLQPAVQGERDWDQLCFGCSAHWFRHEFSSSIRRLSHRAQKSPLQKNSNDVLFVRSEEHTSELQ